MKVLKIITSIHNTWGGHDICKHMLPWNVIHYMKKKKHEASWKMFKCNINIYNGINETKSQIKNILRDYIMEVSMKPFIIFPQAK
jgi:hypothetical protein